MPDKMSEEVEVLVKDRTLLRAKGKLPESWRLEWARQHQPDPGLEDFLGFLRKEMDMREEANIGARHPVPPERSPLHAVSMLATALVEASGPRGTCQLRVLLDGGSDSSYVRTSAAELLGLPTVGRGVFACLGFQERLEEPRMYEKVKLTDHLRALETVFGYVLHGRDGSPVDCEPVDCASVKYALRCCRLPSPDFKPEQLWSLEALGISGDEDERSPMKPKWSDAEQSRAEAESSMSRAEEIFRDAGMELHKRRISGDADSEANVLGLLWNPATDLLAAVLRLAWVFRFVTNSRLPREERRTGPLTPEEKRLSLRFWIREAQARAYREETNAVRAGKLLPAGSPLQKLHLQLSDDGVLEATLRSGERAVPVLPDLAHVTTLIVDDAHRLCFHQGTRVTLSLLTAEYAVRRRTGDGEDLLTPAHLLFGVTSIDGVLCPTLKECSISRAWRHQKRVCDHLIRRWCDEYRNALRCWSVSPRGRPSRTPRVGDVVLVHSERPRGRWPVARVTRLLAGPDGHVRAAVISLHGRSTRHPVSRLFLLEAAD
ncbi:hypothetical protein FJT64_022281 [Amphibalanus amphitrite]|uniref:DUF5641 domain-containing protein n=1 Tax=Amphibalanus amphitrite TaxID=1232801 RepID=A0A6A4WVL2_AMPAM|nr:hypothetical protein FJT64_022281 [Amphibalanus amphitrite]